MEHQLVTGWNLLKLSEIANNHTERYTPKDDEHFQYIGLEHIEPRQTWIDKTGVSSKTKSQKTVFSQGDILFGKLRPYLRKVASPSFNGVCSTDILVLTSKEYVTNKYLLLLLSSYRAINHAIRTSDGTKMPRTSWASLKQLEFPIPPLDEQEKIVSYLDHITEALRLEKKEEIELKRFKKKLIKRLLTQGFGHTKFKKVRIGPDNIEIPETWKLVNLKDVTTKITDGTHFTPTYIQSGIPFLRVTDIKGRTINWDEVKRISISEHNQLIRRCEPEKGDVLYSKNGTIGISKVVDWERKFSIFVSICLIKPVTEIVLSDYLAVVLSSSICYNQALYRSKTGTVTNLHLEEIREFMIPIPSIKEQKEIITKLSCVTNLINIVEESILNLENLMKGLMQVLLTGKMRVKT